MLGLHPRVSGKFAALRRNAQKLGEQAQLAQPVDCETQHALLLETIQTLDATLAILSNDA